MSTCLYCGDEDCDDWACVPPSLQMGPIERELRDKWQWPPSAYNSLSNEAAGLVDACWRSLGLLPTGSYAYANIEDAWSEAIEAAEALSL